MLQRLRTGRAPRLVSRVTAVPVPTGGWDALSPVAAMEPQFAVTLDNWFPQPGYVELRKGFDLHCSPGGPSVTEPVETLMTWQGPAGTAALWAAMDGSLWNVTTGPRGVENGSVGPFTNDRFQWTNFATSGGNYLWACNGADQPCYYDGSNWASVAITGTDETKFVDVVAHRGRLWFAIKDTTKAAYLPLDSIQGAATVFDLGGIFDLGGYLVAVDTWSRTDSGAGPDDYLCFVSSQGQVAIYSMIDPTSADSIFLVGVYNLGNPIGRRCAEKIGPDLAIITVDGVQSLQQAVTMDRSSAATAAITSRIQPAINAVARYAGDNFGWQFVAYPKGSMAVLNVPVVTGGVQQFVMNTMTGAWARFTGQNAHCWGLMNDRLFFGGDGLVLEADVAGGDFGGQDFIADMRTAFSYYGQRGRKKRWSMVQPIINTDMDLTPSIGVDVDFRNSDLTDPIATVPSSGSLWNQFVWDEDNWAGGTEIYDNWLSINGMGYAAAVHMKVTVAGQALGQELVTNESFADWTGDDPDNWTVTESAPNLVTDDTPGARFVTTGFTLSIEQSCMTAGNLYYIAVTVATVVSGALQFGTKADVGSPVSTVGTHTREVLATAGDGLKVYVKTYNSAAADFTITRVSVKEVVAPNSERADSESTLQLMAFNITHETGDMI